MPRIAQKTLEKARAKAKAKGTGEDTTRKHLSDATVLAYAYEACLSRYHHRMISYIKDGKLKRGSGGHFSSAAKLAQELNADPNEFIEAQFYFMHKWYGKAPSTQQLKTKGGKWSADKRYVKWKLLQESGELMDFTSPVMPSVNPELEDILEINQSRLEKLMRQWNLTERECLLTFVPQHMFDEVWLSRNNTYKDILMKGEM